ncbi:MAG: hypothetical protein ACT4TC_13270 [Myxococcaceae bacterium]
MSCAALFKTKERSHAGRCEAGGHTCRQGGICFREQA